MGRDKIAGQDRVLTAELGKDFSVRIADCDACNRRMTFRRANHRLVMFRQRPFGTLVHVIQKAAFSDVQHVLIVDEYVVGTIEKRPLAQILAGGREHLHARILAIGHVHMTGAIDADAMRQHELSGPAARLAPREQQLSFR